MSAAAQMSVSSQRMNGRMALNMQNEMQKTQRNPTGRLRTGARKQRRKGNAESWLRVVSKFCIPSFWHCRRINDAVDVVVAVEKVVFHSRLLHFKMHGAKPCAPTDSVFDMEMKWVTFWKNIL